MIVSRNRVHLIALAGLTCMFAACESKPKYNYGYGAKNPDDIKFKESVATNAEVPANAAELEFIDTAGQTATIGEYREKKNLLLVFTRGFTSPICPFCQTQTSRLVSNYDQFKQHDTEVLLVYPGAKGQLDEFLKTVKTVDKGQVENVPFRILLDDGLDAVRFFGIEEVRASPATYIFDKQGRTQFAYVGGSESDRPSIKAIVEQLERLEN